MGGLYTSLVCLQETLLRWAVLVPSRRKREMTGTENALKGCSRHGRKWQTQARNPVFVQPPLVFPTEITQKVAVWAHFPTLVSSKLSETQAPRRNLIFCWTQAFGFWHAGSFQIPCHCSNSFSFFLVQSNFFFPSQIQCNTHIPPCSLLQALRLAQISFFSRSETNLECVCFWFHRVDVNNLFYFSENRGHGSSFWLLYNYEAISKQIGYSLGKLAFFHPRDHKPLGNEKAGWGTRSKLQQPQGFRAALMLHLHGV